MSFCYPSSMHSANLCQKTCDTHSMMMTDQLWSHYYENDLSPTLSAPLSEMEFEFDVDHESASPASMSSDSGIVAPYKVEKAFERSQSLDIGVETIADKPPRSRRKRKSITEPKRRTRKFGPVMKPKMACPECSEVLGIEIYHMPPKPIETNYDSKFEQIFDTFTGCGTTISDWKVYSTDFKSAIDIFYLGTAAVEHVNKLMKKLDGYDKLTVDDHNSLLETGWEELIVLHSAMVTSESGVFFNVKDNQNVIRAIPTRILAQIDNSLYQTQLQTIMSFPVRWRFDKIFMAIMFGISYYNPSRMSSLTEAQYETMSEIQNIFRFYMKLYLKTIYRDLNYVDLANGYVNDLTSLVSNTSKLMQRRRKNLFMTFMYGFRNIKDYLLPQYDKNKIDLSHIAEMMAKL